MTIRPTPSSVFYPSKAATFSSSANIQGGLAGVSTTSQGFFNFWIKFDAATDNLPISIGGWISGSQFIALSKGDLVGGNKLLFQIQDSTGLKWLYFASIANITSSNNWVNIIAAWDTNFASGSKKAQLFINGVSGVGIVDDHGTAFSNTYGAGTMQIGGNVVGAPYNPFVGSLSEFFFIPGQYPDLTLLPTVRKFLSASKRPVFLGSNGSLPFSIQPGTYLKGSGTGFNVNSGSTGNYTTTGTLSVPSTTPST